MQYLAGSFTAGQSAEGDGIASGPVVVPTGVTTMYLSLSGDIDASNTVKSQKSTDSGQTWSDVTSYNSAQAAASVTVAAGEHWRLITVAMQALKTIGYILDCEG